VVWRVPSSANAKSAGIRIFVDARDQAGYSWLMTAQVAALIEQAKRLTTEERAELADALRATVEVEARVAQTAPGLIGLFASEPDVVDEAMAHVRRRRESWHLPNRP
jgi:hypothetical protein